MPTFATCLRGWAVLALALCPAVVTAAEKTLALVVEPSAPAAKNVPIRVPVKIGGEFAGATVTVRSEDGQLELPGQITGPCLYCLAEGEVSPEGHELVFVLPETPAERPLKLQATLSTSAKSTGPEFSWHETEPNAVTELRLGDKPVLRYMHAKFDTSSDEARHDTFKVFHHVIDPEGTDVITKGPGGQFTHHRGLFYGFSKVTYGDNKKCDIWHCRNAHQEHVEIVNEEFGPVVGSHRVKIAWCGNDGKPFAHELRELTAYNTPGGVLIDFTSKLVPVEGKVQVDGDPQHAGFHFRASNEVASSTKGQTYYLRPDGKDQPGRTRNWPGQKTHADLPWNAMSFVVGGQRYTTVYMDHATNPKEARYSERDYGRFGSYFVAEATEEDPLVVQYRVWVQRGELDGEMAAAMDRGFETPPTVRVVE